MNTWFECKVKYHKIDNAGKDKMVTETYLIDAVSFTEAEERITKELEPYIGGEFNLVSVKIANYSELVPNDNGDRWFKCKVAFISLDEEKGIERRTNTYFMVQANTVKEAYDNLEVALKDTASDYAIPSIQESALFDVFTYFGNDEQADKKKPLKRTLTQLDDEDEDELVVYQEDEDEVEEEVSEDELPEDEA